MKTYLTVSVFATCMLVSFFVFADSIPTKGKWSEKDVRTLVPSPPEASIEENILTIYMADALSNLKVSVIDSAGNIVYEEFISSYGDHFSHYIQLAETTGEYQLIMDHYYGTLFGTFYID